MKALFVHRYDLVRELLGVDALQSAKLADPLLDALPPEQYALHAPIKRFFQRWPVFAHGEYHQRVRAVLRPVLDRDATLATVTGMSPTCREMLAALSGTEVDWVEAFARPYAVALLGRIFGVPADTVRELLAPVGRVMTYMSKPLSLHDDDLARDVRAALGTITTMVRTQIVAQPRTPLAEAMAGLAADDPEGGAAVATQIITGTLDPLITLLTDALLMHRPGTATTGAVAEDLRLSCPIRFAPRHVNRPIEIAGHRLGPGDRVILGLASANLDPARYDDPLGYSGDRSGPPHLAFGQGAHYCLGAPLARWATGELVEALSHVEVHPDPETLLRDGHLSISKVLTLRVRVATA